MASTSFPILQTERLILRQVIEQDSEDILSYLSDERVMKYYGMSPFTSLQEALDEIDWYQSIYDAKVGIRWGISFENQDKIIGSCGFHNWDKRHHRAEIGFELSSEFWGIGIMQEALQTIIPFGFQEYKINRIQALVEPDNTSSRKLLKRMGFHEEGLLVQYEYTVGKYDDLYMLALLRKVYEK